MLKAAITGNMGSGKTTVCKIFESLGVPVFYADTEAKKLYADEEVKTNVKKTFGNDVFDEMQQLNRQRLAAIVFNDAKALQILNAIIHPKLMERYHLWFDKHSAHPYTLHEAAVIFENHLEKEFDFIIHVSCPKTVRYERIKNRDGLSDDEIKSRMEKQWPDAKKALLSQAVINNDGKHFLIPQVLELHEILTQKNSA